jgi:hypothetical protein
MRRTFTIVTALLMLSAIALSQEIRVTATPDTTAIFIGDQTGFSVRAEIPAGSTAALSTVNDTLAGKIVILGRSPRDTAASAEGMITITDRYLVTAFDSGTYTIPPFYAEVVSGDSLLRFYSGYSMLKVLRPDATPPDTTDVIFDIVPPRNAPVTFAEILPWLVIAIIAALVLWLLARFLPRNPLRRFVRPPAPADPAHIIALRELQSLRQEELWQKGEIKEYYSRLSDILRRYIDNRYGISSPELTTDETVRMLQKAAVTTAGQMSMVKELLSLSDMVKFAKYLPQGELHERYHNDAVRFVEETKVPEVTDNELKGKGGGNA